MPKVGDGEEGLPAYEYSKSTEILQHKSTRNIPPMTTSEM